MPSKEKDFMKKRSATLVTAALASMAALGVTAPPAAADSVCDPSYPCMWLYYNSNQQGARFMAASNKSNLAGYIFDAGRGESGYGQALKNNAASATFRADNNFYLSSGTVFYNSGYAGPCDTMTSTENNIEFADQLVNTYNDNASILFRAGYGADHPDGCYEF